MEKGLRPRISTTALKDGWRMGTIVSTVLFALTAVTFTPTTASAFDIQGLIGTAIALQMGAYHVAPYHQARGHVASRHDSDSNTNDSSVERDARDVDVSNHIGRSEMKTTAHLPPTSAGITSQASERDAAANEVASSGRRYDEEPVYRQSRWSFNNTNQTKLRFSDSHFGGVGSLWLLDFPSLILIIAGGFQLGLLGLFGWDAAAVIFGATWRLLTLQWA
jgi:hypothetical protein